MKEGSSLCMVDLISPFYRWANCSSEKQHTWSGLVQRRDRFWLFVLFGQAARGILVPQLGILCPLHRNHGVLTTGPPGNSLEMDFKLSYLQLMPRILHKDSNCLPFIWCHLSAEEKETGEVPREREAWKSTLEACCAGHSRLCPLQPSSYNIH